MPRLIDTDLADSLDLTHNAVVFGPGAACSSMRRQVHTHHMLTFRQILRTKRSNSKVKITDNCKFSRYVALK